MALEIINQHDPEGLRKLNDNFESLGTHADGVGDPAMLSRLSGLGAVGWDSENFIMGRGLWICNTESTNYEATLNTGRYVRKGPLVYISTYINISKVIGEDTGLLQLGGLPLMNTGIRSQVGVVIVNPKSSATTANYTNVSGYVRNGGNTIGFRANSLTGPGIDLRYMDLLKVGTNIEITGFYEVE